MRIIRSNAFGLRLRAVPHLAAILAPRRRCAVLVYPRSSPNLFSCHAVVNAFGSRLPVELPTGAHSPVRSDQGSMCSGATVEIALWRAPRRRRRRITRGRRIIIRRRRRRGREEISRKKQKKKKNKKKKQTKHNKNKKTNHNNKNPT